MQKQVIMGENYDPSKFETVPVATPESFAAVSDSRSSTGYANQAAGGKTLTAEEWWIKTAAILCQKADQSGVVDFRITKVKGKWVFEITPEEQPDSPNVVLSDRP